MKDLNIQEVKEDKIEIVKQQVHELKKVFEGTFKPQKGHTLFELNLELGTIVVAEFDEVPALDFNEAVKGKITSQKKITKKPNCVYVSALNKKNALKAFKKRILKPKTE